MVNASVLMCVDLNNDLDNLGDLTWDKVSCDLLGHNVTCAVCNVVTRIGRILQVSSECTTLCVLCVSWCVQEHVLWVILLNSVIIFAMGKYVVFLQC